MTDRQPSAPRGTALAAVLAALLLAAGAHAQTVLVNEVFTGNPDYVEITNVGVAPVAVSGWTVESSFAFSTYPPVMFPPGTTIAAGASILILEANATLPTLK